MNTFHRHKLSLLAATVTGLCAMGGAQAATLTCGTPLRVSTTAAADWSTDARQVADPTQMGVIRDDYRWQGTSWFDPQAQVPPLTGRWLSFGDGTVGDPAVTINGNVADGYWVNGRATFIHNEHITIGPDVDLATIRVTGTGGADNSALFVVKPSTLPGGVANTDWLATTSMLGGSWGAPAAIDIEPRGFYYGDNTIGFAVTSESTTASLPAGVVADLEITADCLTPLAPQPTQALICPVGNQAGDTIRLGPFTTNARDWQWSWRTGTGSPRVLENVVQPLYDDFIWRSWFKPGELPVADATNARWISPGTVNPAGNDSPGVPYPLATGQALGDARGSVFTLNQPVAVGNNVDLSTIALDGRFGFDNTGWSVFVQPQGDPAPTVFPTNTLPDGWTSFTAATPNAPGFKRGQNTIGLVLNGGEFANDCGGGGCAMGAIADFFITATCTGVDPVVTPPSGTASTQPVPTLDLASLGLLGLLSAGVGALALRRRKRASRS